MAWVRISDRHVNLDRVKFSVVAPDGRSIGLYFDPMEAIWLDGKAADLLIGFMDGISLHPEGNAIDADALNAWRGPGRQP